MFKERNEARRHRDELFRRHVHVIHLGGIDFKKVATVPHRDLFPGKMAAAIDRGVSLSNQVIFLAVSSEILDLVGDTSIVDFAIWRLNETKLVNPRECAH